MKKVLPLLIILVFIVSCNLPIGPGGSQATTAPTSMVRVVTATPAPGQAIATSAVTITPSGSESNAIATPTDTDTLLWLTGVTMTFPKCLPSAVMGGTYPGQPYDPMGGPMEVYPPHRRFDFTEYPLSGTFFTPFMRIFPVADFADAYALADENYAAGEVAALQQLLADRPAEVEGSLPFLVMAGAAQIFHARLEYHDFANGAGISYLTSYGQYSVPYNNHDLFYTFQGLTSDGKYWISAIFPINHPILPPSYDSTAVPVGGLPIPTWDSPTYEDDMTAYYAAMKTLIESQPSDSFTPAEGCLNQYIESLDVGD